MEDMNYPRALDVQMPIGFPSRGRMISKKNAPAKSGAFDDLDFIWINDPYRHYCIYSYRNPVCLSHSFVHKWWSSGHRHP